MRMITTACVVLAVQSFSAFAEDPSDSQKLRALQVKCPNQYTTVALNNLYMEKVGNSFATPNTSAFRQKKQGLWMKNAFNKSGDWPLSGPTAATSPPKLWGSCFRHNGNTYAWTWEFQVGNSSNEAIAFVDLEHGYVGLASFGEDYLGKNKGSVSVEVLTDRTRLQEVLKAIDYKP